LNAGEGQLYVASFSVVDARTIKAIGREFVIVFEVDLVFSHRCETFSERSDKSFLSSRISRRGYFGNAVDCRIKDQTRNEKYLSQLNSLMVTVPILEQKKKLTNDRNVSYKRHKKVLILRRSFAISLLICSSVNHYSCQKPMKQ
jgi:hypothetical protein